MQETTLTMVFEGTPPDRADAVMEIRSRYGTKRITRERLAEITDEAKDQKHFDRLIEQELDRFL
jgi:hypothetical protein